MSAVLATLLRVSPRLLSNDEVVALYADHIAVNDTPEYLQRYDGYDFASRFGEEAMRTMDFPRLVTVLEFERLVREHDIRARNVLMLNGGTAGDPELQYLPHDQADFCDYEADPRRYDLHALDVDRDDYDFVLFSQTVEHLYNPLLALENVHGVLTDGGFVWTSVPTVSHQHQLPHHFSTGLTPTGLACLFAQTGFEIVAIGQWGNAKYVSQLFDLDVVPGQRDLARGIEPRRGVRHALRLARRLSPVNLLADGTRNDFAKPVQTWGLARKASGPAP